MVAVGLNPAGKSRNALMFRCRRMNGANYAWCLEGSSEVIKTALGVAETGNGACPREPL
jgi:hypothetical protein